MNKRLLILVDESNISMAFYRARQHRIVWQYLRDYMAQGYDVIECVLFVSVPPHRPEYMDIKMGRDKFIGWARNAGFMVITREGKAVPSIDDRLRYQGNIDITMAIVGMQLALDMKPDVVMLATGDSDFSYMAMTLRQKGIKVIAAHTRVEDIGNDLRHSVNSVLSLEPYIDTVPRFWEKEEEETEAS